MRKHSCVTQDRLPWPREAVWVTWIKVNESQTRVPCYVHVMFHSHSTPGEFLWMPPCAGLDRYAFTKCIQACWKHFLRYLRHYGTSQVASEPQGIGVLQRLKVSGFSELEGEKKRQGGVYRTCDLEIQCRHVTVRAPLVFLFFITTQQKDTCTRHRTTYTVHPECYITSSSTEASHGCATQAQPSAALRTQEKQ